MGRRSLHNSTSKQPFLSIIIPALGEESVIESTLIAVRDYLLNSGLFDKTEIIIVAADGGDNTAAIAKEYQKKLPGFTLIEPGAKVGKGRDVRLGMQKASGKYILFMDADLATPLHHIDRALEKLEQGAQLTIGVRNLRKIHSGYRSLVSLFGNALTRILIAPSIPDTQCGFKAFTHDAAKRIFEVQKIDGWGFDMEVLALAKKWKYPVQKIHIHDWHDPKIGQQGLVGESGFQAVKNTLKELFKIRLNLLRGAYETEETF